MRVLCMYHTHCCCMYMKRTKVATRRTIQLAGAFSGFVGSYLLDLVRGKVKENEVHMSV